MIELAIGVVCLAVGYWWGSTRLRDGALRKLLDTDRQLREARLNADITRDVD